MLASAELTAILTFFQSVYTAPSHIEIMLYSPSFIKSQVFSVLNLHIHHFITAAYTSWLGNIHISQSFVGITTSEVFHSYKIQLVDTILRFIKLN